MFKHVANPPRPLRVPLKRIRGHGEQPVSYVASYTGSRELLFVTAGDLFGFGALPALVHVNFHQPGDVRLRIANYLNTHRLLLQDESSIRDIYRPGARESGDKLFNFYLPVPGFRSTPGIDKPVFEFDAIQNIVLDHIAGEG